MRIMVMLAFAAMLVIGSAAEAKVHAVSTDGEATVYLAKDFTGSFDLSYDVEFPQLQGNRSWTSVSLLLLGRSAGGASVSVGLLRGSPDERRLSAFTYASRPGAAPVYRSSTVTCTTCRLELRGDSDRIDAYAGSRLIGSWPRGEYAIVRPYVQINGEVHGIGDRIFASVQPLRTLLGGKTLATPTCAFTTQGVRARLLQGGGLDFTGTRKPNSDAGYIWLVNGITADRCRRA